MVRKILFSFCLFLIAFPLAAISLDGIRIESNGNPIIVFIDGQQVCTPTLSCFVANLHGGNYRVEVYAASNGSQTTRGPLLYDKRVYCSGREIKEIVVGNRADERSDRYTPSDRRPHRPEGPGRWQDAMSPDDFEQYMALLKSKSFSSSRLDMIKQSVLTTSFSTDQCMQMLELFTFTREKKTLMKTVYPKISDKQNFYRVVETLTFSTDKKDVNEFIKEYHGSGR